MGIGCWVRTLVEGLLLCCGVAGPDVTRVVVDRLEGDLAVLEVGEAFVDVPRGALPAAVDEGSVLWVRAAPARGFEPPGRGTGSVSVDSACRAP